MTSFSSWLLKLRSAKNLNLGVAQLIYCPIKQFWAQGPTATPPGRQLLGKCGNRLGLIPRCHTHRPSHWPLLPQMKSLNFSEGWLRLLVSVMWKMLGNWIIDDICQFLKYWRKKQWKNYIYSTGETWRSRLRSPPLTRRVGVRQFAFSDIKLTSTSTWHLGNSRKLATQMSESGH